MARARAAGLLLLLALGGCTTPVTPAAPGGAYDPDASYVGQLLQQRSELVTRIRPYASASDAVTFADAVVVGQITDVQPGPTLGADATSSWTAVHLAVRLTDVLAGTAPATTDITVGLAFGLPLDLARVEADLRAMPDVVLYLSHDSPVFDYDPAVRAVLEDGSFLGVVQDGAVMFPGLSRDQATELQADDLTVADLQAAGATAPAAPDVDLSGLVWDHMWLAGAEDAYVFDSLAAAVDGATVVVRGQFTAFEPGRAAQVDSVLSIDEVLAGRLSLPSVRVEFGQASPVERVVEADPGGPVVVLLHERDDRPGAYLVLNRYGLWTEVDGRLVSPLGDTRAIEGSQFATELAGVDTVDELADWIRTA